MSTYQLNPTDAVSSCAVTPAFVRECALKELITSGPGMEIRWMPSRGELQAMVESAKWAVTRGQLFDFGHWPNDMIMEVAGRAGTLYSQGALGHPFTTPYIVVHTWKDEKLPFSQMVAQQHPDNPNAILHSCSYLIHPLAKWQAAKGCQLCSTQQDHEHQDNGLCLSFEVTCLEGLVINGVKMLGVTDRVLVDGPETARAGTYAAHVIPFLWRFPGMDDEPVFKMVATNRKDQDIAHAAAGNAIDPIMVALMLLNTRGVKQQTVQVDPKLNKARVRRGKAPIPPYRKVDSANYVTLVMDRLEHVKRAPQGGTHASPVMHMRLGHWRHFHTGEKTFIKDTLVNATEEMREQFQAQRTHYIFKEGGK